MRVHVDDANTIETAAVVTSPDEPLTSAGDFRIAADGRTAAILAVDSHATYWWIPHAAD
ncbi:MAG TPA: hypothetical protein VKB80_09945 [Kofleriaceae bacterium]|nr:hypothetical protein [Kofleriaceae bacterium]